MEKKSIEQQVRKIVAEKTGQTESRIVPQINLTEDLGADSLDCVEIIMEIEDVLSIEIFDSEIEHVKTFGELVALVTSKV